MSYIRRFMVFTSPHEKDPKWETPVVELEDNPDPSKPPTPIEYQDTRILEQVILDLSRNRARAAGFNAGAQHVLRTFGLTTVDYHEKLKSKATGTTVGEFGIPNQKLGTPNG